MDLVELPHIDHETAGVVGWVAVAAAHPASDDAALQVAGLIRVIVRDLSHGLRDGLHIWRG